MNKKRIVTLSLVVLLVGLLAVSLGVNPLVRAGVETGGTTALKTNTVLEGADLSLFGGRLALEKLEIANPEGFKSQHAVKVGAIDAKAQVLSLLGDTVHVEHVIIERPEITLEVGPGGSNIGALIANVDQGTPASGTAETGDAAPTSSTSKRLHVGLVKVTQPTVTLSQSLIGESTTTVTLGDIELENIGTGPDSTTDIGSLFQAVLAAVMSATARHDGVSDQISSLLAGEIDLPSLEGVLGDLEAEARSVGEELEKTGKDLEDAAKDLFKKR